jgi:hypothetical protein
VLELRAPLTLTAEDGTAALEHARAAYGFPIKWLVANPVDIKLADLTEHTTTRLGAEIASRLAICAAGYTALGKLLDRDVSEVAYSAALDTLTEQEEVLSVEGENVGDRLYRALLNDLTINTALYGTEGTEYVARDVGVRGFYKEGHACFLTETVDAVAREIGLEDATEGIRGLERDKHLGTTR